jgi:hypothetical protein
VNENAFTRDTAITVAVLGAATRFETSGQVIETSGARLLLGTPAPLPAGTLVRIEGNDTLLLGEVCAVDRGPDHWIVAVEIAHSLTSLTELERFNRALLGERTPARELAPSLRSTPE